VTLAAVDPLFAFTVETDVNLALWAVLLFVKLFALCDAVIRKDAAYVAADKQNKAFWLLLLVVFLALHILLRSPQHLLNLIGTIAAFVYLVDVRPTLRSMHSR
jgi:4-amino-4-deoxy-L-arabinose transferase-like glycosyltransferase